MLIIQPNLAQCQDFDQQITKCALIYFVRSVTKISPLQLFIVNISYSGSQECKKNTLSIEIFSYLYNFIVNCSVVDIIQGQYDVPSDQVPPVA